MQQCPAWLKHAECCKPEGWAQGQATCGLTIPLLQQLIITVRPGVFQSSAELFERCNVLWDLCVLNAVSLKVEFQVQRSPHFVSTSGERRRLMCRWRRLQTRNTLYRVTQDKPDYSTFQPSLLKFAFRKEMCICPCGWLSWLMSAFECMLKWVHVSRAPSVERRLWSAVFGARANWALCR